MQSSAFLGRRKRVSSKLNVDVIKQLLKKRPKAFEEIQKPKPKRNQPFRSRNHHPFFKNKWKRIKPKGIISIQITKNNTIMTLTDYQGNAKAWSSIGSCGFQGNQRKSSYATKIVAENLARKTIALRYKWIQIRINGIGRGKIQSAIKPLKRLKIVRILNTTSIPHNGCRAPKKRRV